MMFRKMANMGLLSLTPGVIGGGFGGVCGIHPSIVEFRDHYSKSYSLSQAEKFSDGLVGCYKTWLWYVAAGAAIGAPHISYPSCQFLAWRQKQVERVSMDNHTVLANPVSVCATCR